MLTVLLIILYTFAAVVVIYHLQKNKDQGLSRQEIALSFGFKVLMGIAYGYVFKKYYGGDDTWMHFNDSLVEYNKLLFQTASFFKGPDLAYDLRVSPSLWSGIALYVQDIEYWWMTRSLAVFNLFSRQNYYVDVVFFNLATFGGQYFLFKLFAQLWPDKRKIFFIAVFFIPSIAFWLSGMRSDGWLMLGTGVTVYCFHNWLMTRKTKPLIFWIVGLFTMFIFRYPLFLLIIPALISWGISKRTSFNPVKIFGMVYLLCTLIFFGSPIISPKISMPSLIVKKQEEFFHLKGNTVFALNSLKPTLNSFAQTFPQAFANTFLRPYLWEAKGALQYLSALDVAVFWLLLVFAVLRKWHPPRPGHLYYLCLFFGVSLYLFVGYTVPFPGAIVRYKVIGELFLILGTLSMGKKQ